MSAPASTITPPPALTPEPISPSATAPEPAASIGRTLAVARPVAGRVVLATLLGAAAASAGIALLATSGWLLSRAAEQPSIAALGIAVVGVRFFALSRGVFRYVERLVGHDAAFRALGDLRVRLYARLERLAPAGLPLFHRGDLLSRLVADVDALQDVVLRVIPPFAIAVVAGGATVAVIAVILPSAGVALAVSLLLAGTLVPWWAKRSARRSETRLAAARSELSTAMVDLLEGGRELLAFGATDAHLARVAAADAELTKVSAAGARTSAWTAGATALLGGLAVWAAALLGVPAVADGRLAGVLLAVVILTPLAAFELVAALPAAGQSLERVRPAAARVFGVLDAPEPVVDPPTPCATVDGTHAVRLRDLRARYGIELPWAVDGVDLDLPPGRRVAVVGASGSGKSTLAAVLARFLPYTGSAKLGGVELAAQDGEAVRRAIGLVEQDAHVFDATIEENLRLARPAAAEEELRGALRRARLLDWVDSLPAGLRTSVGEHGAKLSGGQRQRLAIARAFLAEFPVLVLDEPGEHLDTATADAITADVVAATAGRSTLLITHRLSGLAAMDEIVVLDAGRVVERGTHTELVAAGRRYARLWQLEQEEPR